MADYPTYRFFQYFIAHGGIVAGALFATWGLGMRPTSKSVIRVFVLLNFLAIVAFGVNWAVGSNYMFLSRPTRYPIAVFLCSVAVVYPNSRRRGARLILRVAPAF